MRLSARHARADRVDALFLPWSRKRMPGAAVIVVQDCDVLLKKGYGLARLRKKTPVLPDTSFLLASATKPVTALAVMILQQRGRLDYGDPLSGFFPQFRGPAGTITVEQLLHHTSGLLPYEDLFLEEGKIDRDWPRSSKSRPSDYEPTTGEALDLLARHQKLLFEPGEKYCYSNSGYVVLARIVEHVSGRRFADFLREEVFDPIGMGDSVLYDETRPAIRRRARSYSWKDGRYRNVDYTPLNHVYGADGVYSTVEDMARFSQALFTDRPVKQSNLERAFRPGRLNSGEATDYGFGWVIGEDSVWHNGAWLGYRTYILRHLKRRLTVVVLSNCKELNATCMGEEVAGIYLGED